MRVHVLTAITRPDNLPKIAASLAESSIGCGFEVVWHWRFDIEGEHEGGQALKNAMLDSVEDGFVWVLDDDTIVHPDLFAHLMAFEYADAIVVSQLRSDGTTLRAARNNIRVGHIDIGQAIMRRAIIGERRLSLTYHADGTFLEVVLLRPDIDIVFSDEILSYHNALEGK